MSLDFQEKLEKLKETSRVYIDHLNKLSDLQNLASTGSKVNVHDQQDLINDNQNSLLNSNKNTNQKIDLNEFIEYLIFKIVNQKVAKKYNKAVLVVLSE